MQKFLFFASGGVCRLSALHKRSNFSFLMRVHAICGLLLTLTVNLLAAHSTLGQDINTSRVELTMRSTTLKSALKKLEQETGLHIFYPTEIVDKYHIKNIDRKQRTVAQTLDLLLEGTALRYKQRGKNLVLFEDADAPHAMTVEKLQQRSVGGQVVDQDGKPLAGVSIVMRNWQRFSRELPYNTSTASDAAGHWSLMVPSDTTVLVFSFIGYEKQEIRVGSKTSLLVALKLDDAQQIEDVVVTGLFERPKEMYTGAVRSFNQEDLQQVSTSNVLAALRVLDPSFQMPENINLGSNPNALPDVTLRGGNSLLDPSSTGESTGFNYQNTPNTPLFVLDGFEVSLTRINDLDLTRIKSVDILKDATATSIYGSRAANGVIVIETIRPKSGTLRVTYTGSTSVESADLSDYNLLNAREKLDIEQLAGAFNGYGFNDRQLRYDMVHNHRLAEVDRGVNTNWMTLPLQLGIGQRHNVYVEGGDESILYGVGATYLKDAGVMKGSSRSTFTGNMYLSYRRKSFNIKNDFMVTSNKGQNSPYGTFRQYAQLNPYWTPYNDDGSLKYFLETVNDLDGARINFFDGYNNLDGKTIDATNRPTNPLYNANLGVRDETKYTNLTNNTSLQWQATNWLRFNGTVALQFQNDESDKFLPAQHTAFANTPTFERGSYDKGYGNRVNYDVNLAANINKSFGDHQLFMTIGTNAQQIKSYTNLFKVVGFPNSRLDNITAGLGFQEDSRVTGDETFTRLFGFFSNASYSWQNRFLLDFSYRLDGSSQFGANNKVAPFWSIGTGYNLHKDPFFTQFEWLNNFRVRYTYGLTGSQNFDAFQGMTTSRFFNGSDYRGLIGSYLLGIGNPNLLWQKTKKSNVGFDLTIANRLTLSGNYFTETTTGSIGSVSLAPSNGFASYTENIGDMRGRGFELYSRFSIINSVSSRNNWSIFANLFSVRTEIARLSSTLEELNRLADETSSSTPITRYAVGQSNQAIWAVRSLGIDPGSGYEILLKADGTTTTIYDPRDQVIIADGRPDLEGSFGTNFEYKGIGANVFFRFTLGGYAYNQTLVDRVENAQVRFYNVDRRVAEERWQKPGDVTFFKGLVDYGGYAINQPTFSSSRFVQKSDLLSLESLSLYYRLSDNLNKRLGVSNSRITVMTNNLFQSQAIQRERGLDYPFSRTFTFQISTTF